VGAASAHWFIPMSVSLLSRRRLGRFALAAAAVAVSPSVFAQGDFPARPITLVVPAAPSGTIDVAARMLSDPLAKELGQSVIVDNRAGASGGIAAMYVKGSAPDGYTLLVQSSGYHVISPVLHAGSQKWSPTKDFAPVAKLAYSPQVIVVRSELPIRNMSELVTAAKAKPGKLTFASSGNGSVQHITGVLLGQQAGISLLHVPYKGTGPAMLDLLGGQVDMTFATPVSLIPQIQSGKLRALAVTSKARLKSLPQVPTVAEAGYPALDVVSWYGVYAPAGTPKAVTDKISAAIKKVMATEAFQRKAEEQGVVIDYLNTDALGGFTKNEVAYWTDVVKKGKIEAE
jgi:tripartite-type tricarboxylate transporter receptor subunit TctC